MVGMLDNTVNEYKVTERDLKPFTYPPREELMENKTKSVFLDITYHGILKNNLP